MTGTGAGTMTIGVSSTFGASVGLSACSITPDLGLSAIGSASDGVGAGVTTFFESIFSVATGDGEGEGAIASDFGFTASFGATMGVRWSLLAPVSIFLIWVTGPWGASGAALGTIVALPRPPGATLCSFCEPGR